MLLNAPDVSNLRGLRDRAIIAVLLGCGLRRSEVAALTFAHIAVVNEAGGAAAVSVDVAAERREAQWGRNIEPRRTHGSRGSRGKEILLHPYYWAPFFLMGNWL